MDWKEAINKIELGDICNYGIAIIKKVSKYETAQEAWDHLFFLQKLAVLDYIYDIDDINNLGFEDIDGYEISDIVTNRHRKIMRTVFPKTPVEAFIQKIKEDEKQKL